MILPFDIFHVMKNEEPLWIEAAPTMEEARARVTELGESRPGEYIILSQKTGHKISIKVAGRQS